jgi:ribonuclease P protein component
MLKKENRITDSKSKYSQSVSFEDFIVKIRKNSMSINRFSVVVSKKIDKKAVIRNKIKRDIKSALREVNGAISSGHDVLIIVRSGILGKKREDILEIVKKNFASLAL